MKLDFNLRQLNMFNKIGFTIEPNKDYSDDEILEIDETVVKYMQHNGIEDGELNEVGKLCESILDILVDD